MARGTTVYTQNWSSLANYKAFYQPLSTILNQASPRTSDTGQVNWATISTESGTVRDYEIFPMGGSLQATAPIYLRIDYLGGSVGAVSLTVGTTTDGAGNLGGLTAAKVALNTYAMFTGDRYAWAACDGSYFTFMYQCTPLATGLDGTAFFVVERTRDGTGAPTGEGFHVWRWQRNGSNATTYQGGWFRSFAAPFQTANPDYNFGVNVPDLANTNSAYQGNASKAFPVYTYSLPYARGASKALMFGFQNDFPRQRQITMDYYGEMQTWIPVNDAYAHQVPSMSSVSATTYKWMCPLIRWD